LKKSLGTTLAGIALLIGILLMILRKGVWGAGLILVGMAVLLLVVTFVSELAKLHGKKVQGRDRHP
jgi:hypothetical protein